MGYDESKDARHDESRTRIQRTTRRNTDEPAQPLSGNREIRSLCNGGESTQCLFRDYRSPTNSAGDVSQAQRRRAEIGRYQQECSYLSQIRPLLPKGGRVHSDKVSGERCGTERSNAFVSCELRTISADGKAMLSKHGSQVSANAPHDYHRSEEQRMDLQRSVRQLSNPLEESRPRLSDRRRTATHPAKEDAVRTAGTSARRVYLFVLYGIGIHRRAKSDQGKHPHLVRRQAMDYDAQTQDADAGKRTAAEST